MSRISKKAAKIAAQVPVQIKHLRFVNLDAVAPENAILNTGGFTLAYRCLDLARADADLQDAYGEEGLVVRYAYSECHLDENYNKDAGRGRATARLNHMAPLWSGEFLLELERPAEEDVLPLRQGTAIVDLRGCEAELAKEVLHNFIEEQQAYLHNGANMDCFLDYLVPYRGRLALDVAVLLTALDEDEVEDDQMTAINSEVNAMSERLDQLDHKLDTFDSDTVAVIRELRESIATLRALTLDQGVDEPDEDGDEDDEDDLLGVAHADSVKQVMSAEDRLASDNSAEEVENDAQRLDRLAGNEDQDGGEDDGEAVPVAEAATPETDSVEATTPT